MPDACDFGREAPRLYAFSKSLARAHMILKRGGLMNFTRFTVDSAMMGGVPCIRGLRISVATVVGMVAEA